MRITFWGVRGSIASPGPETAGVGGNTSCVEVACGSTRLVLDAGTGIRRLGEGLMIASREVDVTVLLSHLHWDHIQGLPFFAPAYVPSTRLAIMGPSPASMSLREALSHQMTAPVFPVQHEDLGAAISVREVKSGDAFAAGDATVRAVRLNHPGGVLAYRIDFAGRSVVYATDTEHYACVDPNLRKLCEGADVLIYDAQYTEAEYRGDNGRPRVGWGHSTYVAGAEVAAAAGVGRLVLFHHDPQRNDAGVADLEQRAQAIFAPAVAAREGLQIAFDAVARAA